jgi:hypothetical protein
VCALPRHTLSVSETRARSIRRRARYWFSGGSSIAWSLISSVITPPAPNTITGPNGSSVTTPIEISRPRRARAIFCTVTPLMRASGARRATRSIISL